MGEYFSSVFTEEKEREDSMFREQCMDNLGQVGIKKEAMSEILEYLKSSVSSIPGCHGKQGRR